MTLHQALASGELPDPQTSASPITGGILSVREAQVLDMVAQGLTDAEIAARLSLSPHTVNAHLRSVYSKLGVTSRSAATRYAMENNLI